MSVYDDIDPNLVARFAFQELMSSQKPVPGKGMTASALWKSIHGARLFEDVRASQGGDLPFAVVTVVPGKSVLFTGVPEIIGKMKSRLTVVSIRTYASGKGTWFDFDDSYKAMRAALTGINGLQVFNKAGDMIGEIYQAAYVDDVRLEHSDGDFQTLHHGIVIEVIHK